MPRRTPARRRATAVLASAAVVSMWFAAAPLAAADPYDDDTSTESIEPDYAPAPDYDPGESAPDYGSAPEPEPEPDYAPAPDYDPGEPAPDYGSAPEPEPEPAAPAPDESEPSAPEPSVPDADATADAGVDPAEEAPTAPDIDEQSDDPGPDLEPLDPLDLDIASAPQQDVDAALGATPTQVDPEPAPAAEVDEMREFIESELSSTTTVTETSWSRTVSQWDSEWVSYDTYYRPIIVNPYQTPLQLVYWYGDVSRIVTIDPLQRVVLQVPDPGVYSFTALTRNNAGQISNVSAGSFSGGGYVPRPGQPPPAKPAPLNTFQNVLVQMHYAQGDSHPFRVKELTDLGDDPSVGAHKVLLDSETPAWGQWSTTSGGERLFQITKTQLLPGLTAPSEGPLPGYDVQLTSNEATDSNSWVNVMVVVAVVLGALALGAVVLFLILGRRRRNIS